MKLKKPPRKQNKKTNWIQKVQQSINRVAETEKRKWSRNT